jgi:hypothetical protein
MTAIRDLTIPATRPCRWRCNIIRIEEYVQTANLGHIHFVLGTNLVHGNAVGIPLLQCTKTLPWVLQTTTQNASALVLDLSSIKASFSRFQIEPLLFDVRTGSWKMQKKSETTNSRLIHLPSSPENSTRTYQHAQKCFYKKWQSLESSEFKSSRVQRPPRTGSEDVWRNNTP